MRRKIPALMEALTGHFDEHHALLVGAMLHRLDHVQAALAELDARIVVATAPWAHELELLQTIPGVGLKAAQVEPYREVGNDWFDQRHADAHTRSLVAQLKALGHTVVLDPAI
jgi:hypothetical protein